MGHGGPWSKAQGRRKAAPTRDSIKSRKSGSIVDGSWSDLWPLIEVPRARPSDLAAQGAPRDEPPGNRRELPVGLRLGL
jgi:hypothetical protein